MSENIDISELTEQINIVEYVEQYVDLDLKGRDHWGLCPLHNDTDASFSVNEEGQFFKCFGCGAGGDVIEFIQQYHKVNFPKAVEFAKEYAGFDGEVRKPLAIVKELRKFNKAVANSKKSNTSVTQLKSNRKILNRNVIEKYDKIPISLWEDEGIKREVIEFFNVRFNPRGQRQDIILPIWDNDGNLINFASRTTHPQWEQLLMPKYIYYYKLGQLDFFYGYYQHLESIKKKKEIILVEGAKSVMKLRGLGYDNAVAVLTSHLTDEQLRILIKLGVNVVCAFDKDVNVFKDDNIQRLRRYCGFYNVYDSQNWLGEKDSPVDKGKEVWDALYKRAKGVK